MASLSTKGFNTSDNSMLLLVGGAAALAYFTVLKPALDAGKGLLEAVGLKDSENDKKEAAVITSNEKANGWNPSYYKTLKTKNILLFAQASVDAAAKDIYKSRGGALNDDEEKVYGVLRQMKSQAHLSQLADRFNILYKQDLLGYLKSFLSSENHWWAVNEMAIVAGIVAGLPNYLEVKK